MPFLEQRRQPHSAQTHSLASLPFLFFAFLEILRRHWALGWSLLHLGGFLAGGTLASGHGWLAGFPAHLDLNWLTRASAVTPVIIWLGSRSWQATGWLVVLVFGLAGGYVETSNRECRRSEAVPGDCLPAERLQWEGPAALRSTGWPSPGSSEGSWRVPAVVVGFAADDPPETTLGPANGDGVLVWGKGSIPHPGSLLIGRATFSVPPGLRLAGGFDYRKFLFGRGLLWTATLEESCSDALTPDQPPGYLLWLAAVRTDLSKRLEESFPPPEAALLGAVLLGTRTPDSRSLAGPFADLGLAHLFAVSGLHVGILMGIIYLPLFSLGCSPLVRFLGSLGFLALYAALTGMSGSVMRASGLAATTLAALPLGRSRQPLHILGILFWLGMIWLPCQILDAGSRLSYLAAGGILAVLNADRAQDGPRLKGVVGWLTGGLTVSLAALWFTLPEAAASFGRLSLVTPIANLLAVPLFGLGIWVTVLGLALHCCWPFGGDSLLAVAWLILRFLCGGSGWAAKECPTLEVGLAVPGFFACVWFVLLTGLLFWSHRRLRRRFGSGFLTPGLLCALLPVLAFGFAVSDDPPPWRRTVQAWQFDVGQADCSLLVFPDGWATMIDTAGKLGDGSHLGRSVAPFLRRRGRHRLDAVFLTHGHLDHTAGVEDLLQRCPVATWYVGGNAGLALEPWPKQQIKQPQAGDVFHTCGPWSLICLQGAEIAGRHFEENDSSLVLALKHGDAIKMIWNGDLENTGEALLCRSEYLQGPVQVWKAGHHGSSTSGSPELLATLAPHLILISCGVGNRYRHPSHGPYLAGGDTLSYLRTDLTGTIELEWSAAGRLIWRTTTPPLRQGTLP